MLVDYQLIDLQGGLLVYALHINIFLCHSHVLLFLFYDEFLSVLHIDALLGGLALDATACQVVDLAVLQKSSGTGTLIHAKELYQLTCPS